MAAGGRRSAAGGRWDVQLRPESLPRASGDLPETFQRASREPPETFRRPSRDWSLRLSGPGRLGLERIDAASALFLDHHLRPEGGGLPHLPETARRQLPGARMGAWVWPESRAPLRGEEEGVLSRRGWGRRRRCWPGSGPDPRRSRGPAGARRSLAQAGLRRLTIASSCRASGTPAALASSP